jgi:hypothetical protein
MSCIAVPAPSLSLQYGPQRDRKFNRKVSRDATIAAGSADAEMVARRSTLASKVRKSTALRKLPGRLVPAMACGLQLWLEQTA